MNAKSSKIVVAHPRKQHVYELLKTFIHGQYELTFYTTFWASDKLNRLIPAILPGSISEKILKGLKKRKDSLIPDKLVCSFSFIEITRLTLNLIPFKSMHSYALFYLDRFFDRHTAKKIKHDKPDIFIGYEMSSYRSFKQIKKQGGITVLDLAQIHYKTIDDLATRFSCLSYIKTNNKRLYTKINAVKQKEYDMADYIIVLSEFARQSLIDQNIPDKKIKLISLGVNTSVFTPKEIYNSDGVFKIIFAGTIFPRKGIQLLLQALSELNKNDIELTVVGALLNNSNELAQQNYNFKINHISYAPHATLNKLYQASDLFILPSYLDSFGMVVTEAMATGTPAIVTKNTGSSDFVNKGGGKVIDIDSVEDIKNSILYYYHNRSAVKTDGVQAIKIIQHYTWDHYRVTLKQTIDTILEEKKQ